jgi:hypothetical protein
MFLLNARDDPLVPPPLTQIAKDYAGLFTWFTKFIFSSSTEVSDVLFIHHNDLF